MVTSRPTKLRSTRLRANLFSSLAVERLEPRMVLASDNPFELDQLFPENGGDGTKGFVINGPSDYLPIGSSVGSGGDVNGDGLDDYLLGAHLSFATPADPGVVYVVFGETSPNHDMNLAELNGTNGFVITSPFVNAGFGHRLSIVDDLNNDGLDDILIGAYTASTFAEWGGEAFVVFGQRGSFPRSLDATSMDGTTGFRIVDSQSGDNLGATVAGAGDMNGDGIGDIILGASPGTIGSRSYVLFGSDHGFQPVMDVSTLDGSNGFRMEGPIRDAPGAGKWTSVSGAGDFNGDGFADVLVSSFANTEALNGGENDVADVYVALGRPTPFPATLDLTQLDPTEGFRISGLDSTNNISSDVAGAGDINGDGLDDILIGSRYASPGSPPRENEGVAHVVFGRATALQTDIPIQSLNGENGFRIEGSFPDSPFALGAHLGVAARAGDVNGDGFEDILISAYKASPAFSQLDFSRFRVGETFLIFGKSSGFDAVLSTAALNGVNGFRIDGSIAADYSGIALSSGDVDGDGLNDILITAVPYATMFQEPARSYSGKCYVVLGSTFTNAVSQQGTPAMDVLTGSADGEALVGGRNDDTLLGNGGADVLHGGQGDDLLAVSDSNFRRVFGESGKDTLRVDGADVTLDLTTIPDNRVVDIEMIDIRGHGSNTLTLDVREVLAISSTSNTLQIRRNADDTIIHLGSWSAVGTRIVDGVVYEVYSHEAATLLLERVQSPWQNPENHADVDREGHVASQDAMVIINEINSRQVSASDGKLPIALPPNYSGAFMDVNGDGFVVPTDAIIIINLIDELSAEGESGSGLRMVAEQSTPMSHGILITSWSVDVGASPDLSMEQPTKNPNPTIQRAAATDAAFNEPFQSDISRRGRKMAISAPSPIDSILDHFASDIASRWLKLGRPD